MKSNVMYPTPETLHISGYGKKLKKHNDLIQLEWYEEDEKKSLSFTPVGLKHIILSGDHLVSTGAISLLFENNVSFSFLNKLGEPTGYLFSHKKSNQLDLWERQIYLDDTIALDIAKEICISSSKNKIAVLKSIQRSRGRDFAKFIKDIDIIICNMEESSNPSTLMGYEGGASKIYFSAIKTLIPGKFGFYSRIKHPSPDPINVMLSYGYGILYSKIRFALIKFQLNPFYGVLHSSYRKQEALIYDLIEEFRQPVVDKVVLTMVGRKQVSVDYFSMGDDICLMSEPFKKDFAGQILSRLETETKYHDNRKSFEDIILFQAEKLKNAILNQSTYEAFLYDRR